MTPRMESSTSEATQLPSAQSLPPEPYLEWERLYTPDGRDAGWWVPTTYGLRAGCAASERPEGLRHLLNARQKKAAA